MTLLPDARVELRPVCDIAAKITAFGAMAAQWSAVKLNPLVVFELAQFEVLGRITIGVCIV